jgi:hypothetical protein
MKLRERVAELRRQLLQGAVVEDNAFIEAPSILVPATPRFDLHELFTAAGRSAALKIFLWTINRHE